MDTIRILDIEVSADLINFQKIADESGLSYTYTCQLLYNMRKSPTAKGLVRDAVVRLYGSLIKYRTAA